MLLKCIFINNFLSEIVQFFAIAFFQNLWLKIFQFSKNICELFTIVALKSVYWLFYSMDNVYRIKNLSLKILAFCFKFKCFRLLFLKRFLYWCYKLLIVLVVLLTKTQIILFNLSLYFFQILFKIWYLNTLLNLFLLEFPKKFYLIW